MKTPAVYLEAFHGHALQVHKAAPFIIHGLVVFTSTPPDGYVCSIIPIALLSHGGIIPHLPSQQHRRWPHGCIATTLLHVLRLIRCHLIPPVLIYYLARPRRHRPLISVPSAIVSDLHSLPPPWHLPYHQTVFPNSLMMLS